MPRTGKSTSKSTHQVARIVSLGAALQDTYLIDRDDFTAAEIGDHSIFAKLEIGTKVDIDRVHYFVGGGGTNSATSFARHGHEAIFLGCIGHDPAGEAVLQQLSAENVNHNFVTYAPRQHTGCSTILLDAKTGERTILTHRGAAHKFDRLDAKLLNTLRPDWLYITTLGGDLDTLKNFCRAAKAVNAHIMLNPGILELQSPQKLLKIINKYVDVLLVNKSEAAMLVPGTILTELLSRLGNYLETVIITDGSMGAIATNHAETYRFGIYEDVKIKDTTGAGDAFGSGFLAHFAAGHSFRQSLIFGAANSTAVVQKLGAKAGILTGQEPLHPMPIQRL